MIIPWLVYHMISIVFFMILFVAFLFHKGSNGILVSTLSVVLIGNIDLKLFRHGSCSFSLNFPLIPAPQLLLWLGIYSSFQLIGEEDLEIQQKIHHVNDNSGVSLYPDANT
jgi:hypothetical protein